jgi:hypothetical protein
LAGRREVWLTGVRFEIFTSVPLKKSSVHRLLVTANGPSSKIFVTLMMEVVNSYERSVLTRATPRHISEDGILLEDKCLRFAGIYLKRVETRNVEV